MAEQLTFWLALDQSAHQSADPEPAKEGATSAPAKPRKGRKRAKASRKCLGPCGKPFMSTGPGNRFCGNCRRLEAFADGAAEYSVQY